MTNGGIYKTLPPKKKKNRMEIDHRVKSEFAKIDKLQTVFDGIIYNHHFLRDRLSV